MSAPAMAIAESERGHRRGVVLGLTMAELMLLLLFCLLLVAASLMKEKETQIEALKEREAVTRALLAKTLPEVGSAADGASVADMRLALVLVSELRARGIDPASLDLSGLMQLDAEVKLELERLRALSPDPAVSMPDENWTELVSARDFVATIKALGGNLAALMRPEVAAALSDLSKKIASEPDVARRLQPLFKENWTTLVAAETLLREVKESGGNVHGLTAPGMAPLLTEISERAADPGLPEALSMALAQVSGAGEKSGKNIWPPIITLADDGYSFSLGSAEITSAFSEKLRGETGQQLASLLDQYGVDVIEVVGHTDELSIKPRGPSNLDKMAIGALTGTTASGDLIPADNAGLGLSRAIAVASTLRALPQLAGVKIIPYSAAQLVMPGDSVADGSQAGDQKQRRRIEIRLRRSNTRE